MSFLTQRLLSKRGTGPPAAVHYERRIPEYQPPIIDPMIMPKEHQEEPQYQIKLKEKKKYEEGRTKPEIIENIIEHKPPIAQVRKAIQSYIKMTEDERDD